MFTVYYLHHHLNFLLMWSFSLGIYQWLLLVLLWKRCHWWDWKSQLLQSSICCEADIQLIDWIYSGKKLIPQPAMLNRQCKDITFNRHFMMCFFFVPSGPVYWKPAEFSSQQTVGCSCGFLACICQHANEAVSGIINLAILIRVKRLPFKKQTAVQLERIQLPEIHSTYKVCNTVQIEIGNLFHLFKCTW